MLCQVFSHGPPGVSASLLPGRPVPGLPGQASRHQSGHKQVGDHGNLGGTQEEFQADLSSGQHIQQVAVCRGESAYRRLFFTYSEVTYLA